MRLPDWKAIGIKENSPHTDTYNCIAFAAADESKWWDHQPGNYWPIPRRSNFIGDLVDVYRSQGFSQVGELAAFSSKHPQIVLYSRGPRWTHAAKLVGESLWASKLGQSEDILHPNPECLGPLYGSVYCYMRKA